MQKTNQAYQDGSEREKEKN